MIGIIDYQLGNLGSVLKAFQYLEIPAVLTGEQEKLSQMDGLVLPGVGAFGEGMNNLKKLGLVDFIKEVAEKGRPILGICLGMQLLFEGSEESAFEDGLGLIPGDVRRFKPELVGKVPHIGWNQVEPIKRDPVLSGLKREFFYFVHSFYPEPADDEVKLGVTSYGNLSFTSLVRKDNTWGIQCHPEKSSQTGLKFLKNFSEVVNNGGNSGS